jgi:hypothetical protein
MPVHHLVIWDAPAVAWSLQEALRPLLPVPVWALGSAPTLPSAAGDTLLLIEILLPAGCGLAEAVGFKRHTQGRVAVMGVNPLPLYAWVAWELHLAGCLDKGEGWEAFVAEVQALVAGQSVWPAPIWRKVESFEAEVGWRLRALRPQDWERWQDLMAGAMSGPRR